MLPQSILDALPIGVLMTDQALRVRQAHSPSILARAIW